MAKRKRDITKRPRRGLTTEERSELFREFKLGLFALSALVILVVALLWDRGDEKGPGGAVRGPVTGKQANFMRVVWEPRGPGGSPSVTPAPRHQPPEPEPQEPKRVEPKRVEPPRPRGPIYRNYKVRRRDNYWKIAERHYGSGNGKLWKRIQDANPGVSPRRLRPGKIIRVPISGTGASEGGLAVGPEPGEGEMLISNPVE